VLPDINDLPNGDWKGGWAASCAVQRERSIQSYTPNSQGAQGRQKIAVNLSEKRPAVEPLGRRRAVGETLLALGMRSGLADSRSARKFFPKVCTDSAPAPHYYLQTNLQRGHDTVPPA
jgi:hypothetical protein